MFFKKKSFLLFIAFCIIAFSIPLINTNIIFPAFSDLIVSNIVHEAELLASHLSLSVVSEEKKLRNADEFAEEMLMLKKNFRLERLKVFSRDGKIIYSSDQNEVGTFNREPYFLNQVSIGKTYSKNVEKNAFTMEGRKMLSDVVEVYVPIMKGGAFLGAFEIYYDISRTNSNLNSLTYKLSFFSFVSILVFFLIVLVIYYYGEQDEASEKITRFEKIYQSPLYLILLVIVAIFISETVVMAILADLPNLPKFTYSLFDSYLLVVLISPVLYIFLLRPLSIHISKSKTAEARLRKAHNSLNILAGELEAKISHLNKMDRIKTDFIANVSHEIKTPLTSIKGFIETLEDGAIKNPEKAERFLSIIKKNTDNLTNITDDLLNLSVLELGTDVIDKTDFDLSELAGEVISGFAVIVSGIGGSIRLKAEGRGFMIYADMMKVKQILQNLIDNSVKYGGEGCRIIVTLIEKNEEIIIEVKDNGIGISEEHIDRVFERFYRVDKARSRGVSGTGLGLSIVNKIVLLHGGHIGIESESGKGSKIIVSLPKKI